MTGEKQKSRVKPYLILGLGLIMVIAGWVEYHYGATTGGIIGMVAGAVFVVLGGYDLARGRRTDR
ncbi:putative membrane protein [Mycolicibacterium sp. BK556]|uniref:hypothetical protein n=1 Tax=Mycobacteriaceae TaxID=1762 RepID=UPI00105FB747|nr:MULTISPECIES: hypothetical protein [Mycobacteriaceae]MBB3606180.1 putative membrane protein [Mycolicibacterium sp. BK556]MBB3632758.1 putative membrane protein [Mycolicibacterium sp. BK607]MBB3754107.1 putative membrane protein [Mycolicibacterium sp. BK634]TDO17919.1 hypothetical protein EV580_1097 [Mycobacterium sp. BK086]